MVIYYRRFGTTCRVPSSGFKNPKPSLLPQYGVYIFKSVGGEKSVESANRVHASGWDGGECGRELRVWVTVFLLDSWTLRMGPTGGTGTSVTNCHYSLRNDPEERSSQLLRGGSLKSWFLITSRRTVRLVFKRLGVLLYTIMFQMTYQ